ncbi:hypothetical protein [Pedobacter ghigonis]|uniref:hypothetical protein n=1 Tax=Pedobacter ghigonis TaxID=2730403 RepID=UPI00158A49FB|nr:hypothetical protein [Pedobacter ghigonis]
MKRFTFLFCLAFLICSHTFALQKDTLSASLLTIKQDHEQENVKQNNKPDQKQQQPEPAKIKEVPKARRQLKPMAVKPNVKVKPIKIIKPKIKRP